MGEPTQQADHMRRFWDARAKEDAFYFVDNTGEYRKQTPERFFAEGERQLDDLLRQTEVEVRPDEDVVDIGCGVGRLTRVLAGRAKSVQAIDVSEEMLAQAREHHKDLTNVTWHHGDGTSLGPIADRSADGIVSHVVFQHIPDPEITYGYIREMGRVLRPGGWAAFQVSNDPAIHEGAYKPPSRLRTALGLAPKGQRDPAWRGSAVDLDRLRQAVADGGLTIELLLGEGTQFCYLRLRKEA
ncbi:class I SAM-dependent methyltransferase [Conexibacter sp. SYSU D00693]|uniref:class I SAM-dependent methyltransferase n=1 Tax=Conexibacter sp. SYSU D00693 TaxID=2812560 RepID=UPI00196A938B|nr:class I SAM-dependent methyltransferase [Conexibacter sp. SYSU D00693]